MRGTIYSIFAAMRSRSPDGGSLKYVLIVSYLTNVDDSLSCV